MVTVPLLLSLPFLLAGVAARGRINVTVTGDVLCAKKPAADVQLELWDGNLVSEDDLLASGKSDKQGHFSIFGVNDVKTMGNDVYLLMTHTCGVSDPLSCTRTSNYPIGPAKYGSVYEMQQVALDIYTTGEEERCE
ncbi:unnamed protein product, partial [Mesorhabditis spiculigera]